MDWEYFSAEKTKPQNLWCSTTSTGTSIWNRVGVGLLPSTLGMTWLSAFQSWPHHLRVCAGNGGADFCFQSENRLSFRGGESGACSLGFQIRSRFSSRHFTISLFLDFFFPFLFIPNGCAFSSFSSLLLPFFFWEI